jgi:VWFA-related protein
MRQPRTTSPNPATRPTAESALEVDRQNWLTTGFLILAALTLLAFPVHAQDNRDFQINVRVDEVIVPFSVRNDEGDLVPGLTEEDFTVLEDGRVQTLSEFSDNPAPLSVALLFDTGLKSESMDAIVRTIPSIVDAFADFDEVAVYRFDNGIVQLLDFEEDQFLLDRERLRGSLETLTDLSPTIQTVVGAGNRLPPPSPVINGVPLVPGATPPPDRDRRVLHDAIYEAAAHLRTRPDSRRRVIIVVTDGTDERSEADPEDVQLTLLENNIQVYPIGLNVELIIRFTDSLDAYADITGGRVIYTDSESLDRRYSAITGQARNQYLLTYVSNNPVPTDRIPFREIKIQGPRGLTIEHRAGYYQVP